MNKDLVKLWLSLALVVASGVLLWWLDPNWIHFILRVLL